jgi:hypothetical protein
MTVDHAVTAWESMLADAYVTGPAVSRRTALRGHAIGAVRITVLLVLAALAILVLLPALASQAAIAG